MKNSKTILMGLALAGSIFFASCKKDDLGPTVSPNGGDVYVDLHGTYSEQGATASDAKDGDISSSITTSGSVDVNNAGVYTITYSASDKKGNTGTASRTVYVRHTANTIAATYAIKDTCSNTAPTFYSDVLTASSSVKVLTTKFANYTNANVNFDVSGSTGSSITVPSQTVNCGIPAAPRAFTGSGSISADGKKMTITYVEVNTANSSSITCTGIYTK
ncbi:MAG: DUF5011 domain-containing protein [Bacteroidetes bacterium]|nr:DUF5011 domain-containing protein [Bacteroidota bacterium]